jgi:transposase InsO family protein
MTRRHTGPWNSGIDLRARLAQVLARARRVGTAADFGFFGKRGRIAVVERFIRSLKSECTRNLVVPYRRDALRREIAHYCAWHNEHRPSQARGGRTPVEARDGATPANMQRRYEPRRRWPLESRCAEPQAKIEGDCGARI